MFIPIRTDVPMKRYPYANFAILGLILIAYIAEVSAPREAGA
jgi:hypothetical protein